MYRRDGVLHRAEQEPPAVDSGIDSDDSARELAVEIWRQQEFFHMMEQVDSTDDELGLENQALGSPKPSRNQDWEDPVLKQPGLYNKFLQSLKRRGSCEDLALQQNREKRKIYGDPMENMEEGRAGLMPMLRHGLQLDDGSSSTPGSPDRSSPPLLEVELTASDEDEDSVLELVIPLQSAKGNRAHNPSGLLSHLSLFCTFFCCFRDLNLY